METHPELSVGDTVYAAMAMYGSLADSSVNVNSNNFLHGKTIAFRITAIDDEDVSSTSSGIATEFIEWGQYDGEIVTNSDQAATIGQITTTAATPTNSQANSNHNNWFNDGGHVIAFYVLVTPSR